jgi:hypothetical protein
MCLMECLLGLHAGETSPDSGYVLPGGSRGLLVGRNFDVSSSGRAGLDLFLLSQSPRGVLDLLSCTTDFEI